MTTPRDDIAGLSERLRPWRSALDAVRASGNVQAYIDVVDAMCDKAATQLGSLLKERDALQAENFTLRAKLHNATEGTSAATKQAIEDELRAELAIAECLAVEMEARALRAEQERDALQARVKELEKENGILRDMLLNPDPDIEPDNLRLHREKCDAIDRALVAESRALRAEQERDEAIKLIRPLTILAEDTARVSCKHGSEFAPEMSSLAERARSFVRRLAGPEKEG